MDYFLQYHREPITLSSGLKSHWFVDGRLIFEDVRLREAVLEHWLARLAVESYWHLSPVLEGGKSWMEALGERLEGVSWGQQPENAGTRPIAIIEDVMTTGCSAVKAAADMVTVHSPWPLILCVVERGKQKWPFEVVSWARLSLPFCDGGKCCSS